MRLSQPFGPALAGLFLAAGCHAVLAAERPFRDVSPFDDFEVREETITMRDGVGLYALIAKPAETDAPLPILLQRTPYDAQRALRARSSPSFAVNVGDQFLGRDFVYVFQDIRGRFKSGGDFRMYRAPRGRFNTTETDESTDAWDTIDWLVDNVPSNGRVGVWGNSYPGWLTLAAIHDPHPAIAAAVPLNPVVDVWKADDWFHWGAFRAGYAFDFIHFMQTRTDQFTYFAYPRQDMYDWMRTKGAAATALSPYMDQRHEMWDRIVENPAYGPYWQAVAADTWFRGERPDVVPTLHVHGYWDQEDIYGAPAVYSAMEKRDPDNDRNYFVAGPWYHGQHFGDGSRIGDISFDQDTAKRYREDVLIPFLRHHLHGDHTRRLAPVTAFETGSNRWRRFDRWPPAGDEQRVYLHAGGRLTMERPDADDSFTEYRSDPDKPVPYAPRPNWALNYANPPAADAWRRSLVEDQRFVDGRPDVVTWTSEPLREPLTIRGAVTARLFAETTGTDADWVVKLIDVYPDDAREFGMSGYQLMVSGEIFRGRYRQSYSDPEPIEPDTVLEYAVPMPHVNHVFLPGHRVMVQVQSTWFPLYDRNPQTFVPSIMHAPESAYEIRRHRVHHSRAHPSAIVVRVDAEE